MSKIQEKSRTKKAPQARTKGKAARRGKASVEETILYMWGDSAISVTSSTADTTEWKRLFQEAEPGVPEVSFADGAALTLPEGYKLLDISPCKDCVSYRADDGSIMYKVLTHKLSGSSIEFGISCGRDGRLGVYSFKTSGTVDTQKVAEIKASKDIFDPMYALISKDCLYIIYNHPSPQALAKTPANRAPSPVAADGSDGLFFGLAASGHPNVATFNLITKESFRAFPLCTPMSCYSAMLFDFYGKPAMMVYNLSGKDGKDDARPKMSSLFSSLFSDEQHESTHISFPEGLSTLRFVEEPEIAQVAFRSETGNEGISVILDEDAEDGRVSIVVSCRSKD